MPHPQHPSASGRFTAAATPASPAPTSSLPAAATTAQVHSTQTLNFLPYLTAGQIEALYAKQRASKLTEAKWNANRNLATGLIQAVASRLGFPQRTTATAQQVYQRFHLFYPPSDFVLHEVALASLVLAAKLNDTPKKAREILLASYAFRFPELVKGEADSVSASLSVPAPSVAGTKRKAGSATTPGESSWTSSAASIAAIGSITESDIDATVLETDRKRLMALEKLMLESICFNFQLGAPPTFAMVVKICSKWKLPRTFARTAWRVAADMFRATAPLQYPPNVIASASVYAAALLAVSPASAGAQKTEASMAGQSNDEEKEDRLELAAKGVVDRFRRVSWPPSPPKASEPTQEGSPSLEKELGCHVEDVEEAIHELLDLYLAHTSLLPPSLFSTSTSGSAASASSATPSPQSPADHLSDRLTSSPASPADHIAANAGSGSSAVGGAGPSSGRRKKLKQHEFSPPPLALMDWLNTHRAAAVRAKIAAASSAAGQRGVGSSASAKQGAASASQSATARFTSLLTDLKIYLRQTEYERQKADDAYLASRGLVVEVVYPPVVLPGSNDGSAVVDAASSAPTSLADAAKDPFLTVEIKPRPGEGNAGPPDGQADEWTSRIQRRKWVSTNRALPLPIAPGCTVGVAATAAAAVASQNTDPQLLAKAASEGLITQATRFLF